MSVFCTAMAQRMCFKSTGFFMFRKRRTYSSMPVRMMPWNFNSRCCQEDVFSMGAIGQVSTGRFRQRAVAALPS